MRRVLAYLSSFVFQCGAGKPVYRAMLRITPTRSFQIESRRLSTTRIPPILAGLGTRFADCWFLLRRFLRLRRFVSVCSRRIRDTRRNGRLGIPGLQGSIPGTASVPSFPPHFFPRAFCLKRRLGKDQEECGLSRYCSVWKYSDL